MLSQEPPSVRVTAENPSGHRREQDRYDLDRRNEVETSIERCFGGDRQGETARVRVRTAVGDEGADCASVALDLELRLEPAAPLGKSADDRPREGEIARTSAFPTPAEP